MVKVALAGATSGFGLTVLRTFMNVPNKHEMVVLSRRPNPPLSSQGVTVIPVDYTSHSELVSALRGVHTVLSFIGTDFAALEHSQIALLNAAVEAGVRRFAPSEFAAATNDPVDAYAVKEIVWQAALRSGLEVTKFACGLFMNILGTGTPKGPSAGSSAITGEEEALGGLRPWNYVINMKAGTADLPADGNQQFVMTETNDVGRFVLAALDLEKWDHVMGMRGDVTTFRQLIGLAEKAQGRKFLAKENSVMEMQRQIEGNEGTKFYNQTRIALANDWMMVPDTLNGAVPDVKPVSAKEYVEKWWAGVEGLPEPAWTETAVFSPDTGKMHTA